MDHETKKYSHPYVPGREQPMIETVYVLQQQQRLMGRWLFFILVAVLFCFSMLFVLLPYLSEVNPGVREDAGTVGKVSDESVVLDEIRILKSQVGSLITESIQIKVNQLEKSLLDGMISKSDLVAIQELKSDLKVNYGNSCDVLGDEHVVQIRTAIRNVVDNSALKAKVSRQFLLAHTSQKEVVSVATKALIKINTLKEKEAA